MQLFNSSLDDEGLRYSRSPASTPNLVEAPPDRVQSMHLSTTENISQDKIDPEMRTLDLLDETSEEIELEPQMGEQKAGQNKSAPLRSADKPRSYFGGVTSAAYVSQCFNNAHGSGSASPSSVYSRPQTLTRQPLYELPRTKYEIVSHNPVLRPSTTGGLYVPSPLSQVFHPATTPQTPLHATEAVSDFYHVTQAPIRSLPRKEDLPHMLINNQSFMRHSNEHAPMPPLMKRSMSLPKRRGAPSPPPIFVSACYGDTPAQPEFEAKNCLTFGVRKDDIVKQEKNSSLEKVTVLLLILRCHDGSTRQQGRSHIIIPAAISKSTKTTTPDVKEQEFGTWNYDDMLFFGELRHEYKKLNGPFRHFSARSLQSIRPLCLPNIESEKAPFSEKKMMQYFRSPKRGKRKYEWVQWIQQLSDHKKQRQNNAYTEDFDGKNVVGLEFVLAWSISRILLVLLFVTLLAISVAILWILLGTRVQPNGLRISIEGGNVNGRWGSNEDVIGYHHAGERVVGGMLAGIFTLMVGWMGVVNWIVVSWLVE